MEIATTLSETYQKIKALKNQLANYQSIQHLLNSGEALQQLLEEALHCNSTEEMNQQLRLALSYIDKTKDISSEVASLGLCANDEILTLLDELAQCFQKIQIETK